MTRKSWDSTLTALLVTFTITMIGLLDSGRDVAEAAWPCVGLKCPGRPELTCSEPNALQCPNPKCTRPGSDDPACHQTGLKLKCRHDMTCEDMPYAALEARTGRACTRHTDCPRGLACTAATGGSKVCRPRAGSYLRCQRSGDCRRGEVCEEGVCLLQPTSTYTDPSVPRGFVPDKRKSHGPCMDNRCSNSDDICIRGECYPRSILPQREGRGHHRRRKYDENGHPMPPQPGSLDCRDAQDDQGSSMSCRDNEDLCDDEVYGDLMEQQCPDTCGLCDESGYRRRRRRVKREAVWMFVNNSSSGEVFPSSERNESMRVLSVDLSAGVVGSAEKALSMITSKESDLEE